MKFFLILLGLFIVGSSSFKKNDFYQLLTSHPHALEKILPHVDTIYREGRLWVVKPNKNAPKMIFNYLRFLSGSEKSYFYEPKNQYDREALDPIKTFLNSFNQEAIKKDVEHLSSFKTRKAGTEDNREALASVKSRFESMGYLLQEDCYRADVCSIVAEKAGFLEPYSILMVMAHIDSVGATLAGADDNASGVAVMLEMARNLAPYKNKKTIRFFVTNGEENGLLGATFYAKKLEQEGKLKELALVINMDMVGYNSNGILELETDSEFEETAQWMAELAAQYTTLKSKITLGAWGSDHVPFLERGVDAILTIEDWSTKTPCYHRACDLPNTLNYVYATEIGKLNTAAILKKD